MKCLFLLLSANLVSSLGWAGWSPWTPCSKSCGGGVSQQLRRCLEERCSGHSTRYRVCNVLDCEKPSRSTRDTICSGEIILSKQQCEVVCKSRTSGTQFLWRVADGTPCQAASTRAVCSQGSCQVVGCDDIVGSSLRFDACGVCGGRGDTCDSAQFVWKESGTSYWPFQHCTTNSPHTIQHPPPPQPEGLSLQGDSFEENFSGTKYYRIPIFPGEFTPCAGSCDDAQQATSESRSVSVCINANTGRVVPERLCADRLRPKPQIRACPPLICPSSWLASDWTECNPPCGGGTRTRSVYCIHKTVAHSVNVPDSFCVNQSKPVSEETCGDKSCGRWHAGRWSRCSVSCGQGVKTRSVECVGGTDCGLSHRPISEEVCYAGVPCPIAEAQALTMSSDAQNVDWGERRMLDGSSYSPMDGGGGHSPRVVPGPWSDCSTTCGPGVQSRIADCIALHPITAHVIKLPFIECQTLPQPTLFQPCEAKACPLQEDAKVPPADSAPYRWEYGEWSPCSASCLGGKQIAQRKCVEAATGRPVAWALCDHRTSLPEKSRNCNQQACPPLWQVGAYDACTASCGGGVSTRAVKCVRPVSRSGGADAHIVLPDGQCPSPKPPHTQNCGAVACPANWIAGEWTECSASCGSGEQRRRVTCEGKDARGRRDRRSEKECPGDKPIAVQMCSLGSCEKPQLLSNRIFEQTASEKKLTIGIGGFATVYQGTSIKVKCPTKGFNKKKIWWAKNGRKIRNDAHIKVSTNGHLRIFHARLEDAGVYECFTDSLQGNVTLIFKYRDEDEAHRLKPSEMLRPDQTAEMARPNASFIEALLNAKTEQDIASELRKYGDLIKAEWNIGHWSDCKQATCGVAGYQARGITCHVAFDGTRRRGDDSICSALAGSKPAETRPCHRGDCPRWEASDWTDCSVSKCIRDGLAQQKREVKCVFDNGTTTDEMRCDRTNQPKTRKECETQMCKAEWRSSEWGSCSSTCGTGGVQLRLLSCVWAAAGKAAGRSCEGARRPSAARACPIHDLPPCRPEALALMQDASCEDQSRFCDIIKLFHTCDSNEVRQKCCATCRYMERSRV